MFRQGDLPRLDLQVDRLQSQREAYLSLSGLDKEDQPKQVLALMLCISRETMEILGLTREQRANADHIVDAISLYVAEQLNESVECRIFRHRSQQHGE